MVRRLGCKPERRDSARSRDLVGPGAGGIDQDRRARIAPGAGFDVQPSPTRLRRAQRGIGPRRSPPPRRIAARQAAWKRGDVDVGAARLEPGRRSIARASPGSARSSSARSSRPAHRRRRRQLVGPSRRLRRSDEPRRARRSKRRRRTRPAGVEHRLATRGVSGAPAGAAIAFEPESRRAAGRMIAAQILGLDRAARAAVPASSRAKAGAGDPAADDQSRSSKVALIAALVTDWKAAPSRGAVMINAAFTELLLGVLAMLLIVAAVDRRPHLHHFQRAQPRRRAARAALLVVDRPRRCGPTSAIQIGVAAGVFAVARRRLLPRHDGRRRRQARGRAGAVVLARRRRSSSWSSCRSPAAC